MYMYKYTTSSRSRTIDPPCSKEVFMHSTHFTTAALPLSMVNKSYYIANLINR